MVSWAEPPQTQQVLLRSKKSICSSTNDGNDDGGTIADLWTHAHTRKTKLALHVVEINN